MEEIHLPEEIWIEIFLKLPMKSCLRSSCVSKSWHALIRSPYFVDKQCQLSCCHMVFVRRRSSRDVDGYDELLLETGNHIDTECHLHILPPNLELPFNSGFDINGSCNGILCFSEFRYGIVYLYNPITREHLKLPDVDPRFNMDEIDWNVVGVGFGYVNSSKDYKVIRFHRIRNKRNSSPSRYVYIDIYKLSTNSWTKSDIGGDIFKLIRSISSSGGVFLNGSCYWMASDRHLWRRQKYPLWIDVILKFDFLTETFELIKIPFCFMSTSRVTLGVLNDSLAFISKSRVVQCNVMVKEEDGDEGLSVWSKKFSVKIGPEIDITNIYTCWNIDEDDDKVGILGYDGRHIMSISCFPENGCCYGKKVRKFDDVVSHYSEAIVFRPTLVSFHRLAGKGKKIMG